MTQYAVWLKDQAGDRVAVLDSWPYLQYALRVNDRATYELHLSAERDVDRAKIALFALDGQVEVYRKPDGQSWALEMEGLHRRTRTWAEESGQLSWSSVGRGYEDLLRRRRVVPAAGAEAEAESGAACNVLRAYVRAQAGSGAIPVRQVSGLTVEADAGGGPSLEWSSRYGNLLEECQKIADAARGKGTPVWFAVVGTGEAAFEFRAGAAPKGTDRRSTLVFTQLQGNMVQPETVEDRLQEENYLYVAGQGEGAARTIEDVADVTAVAASPWNRCEGFVDARDLGDSTSLEDRGRQRLSETGPVHDFAFQVAQVPSCRYGVHWFVGDWAKARFLDVDVDVEIEEVVVTVSSQGETISAGFRVL